MHRATAVIDPLFAEFNRLFIPILLHHIMILLNVIQVLAKNVLQLKRKSLSVRQRSDVASNYGICPLLLLHLETIHSRQLRSVT